MRGGGTAGGPSRKFGLEAVKHVPKFLEGLKVQYVKKEAKLEDKFGDNRYRNEFAEGNANPEDYDLENAQVVDESGDIGLPDAMPDIMPDHRSTSNISDAGKKRPMTPKKTGNEKVDLKEFHPTFKSKKPATSNNDEHGKEEKVEAKKEKKELKEDKREEKKEEKKEKKQENGKSANDKRSLDTYIKDYAKEEQEKNTKHKKVKASLLSFDDNE